MCMAAISLLTKGWLCMCLYLCMCLPSQHLIQRCRGVLLDRCRSDRLCWVGSCECCDTVGLREQVLIQRACCR